MDQVAQFFEWLFGTRSGVLALVVGGIVFFFIISFILEFRTRAKYKDQGAEEEEDAGDGADTYADIADPATSDAWYALTDDVVTALDEQAAAGLAGPTSLSAYAQVLHDRSHGIVDADKTDTRKSPHTLDLAIIYTGVGVLVFGAFIATTTFVYERRVMAPLRESPKSKAAKDSDQAP